MGLDFMLDRVGSVLFVELKEDGLLRLGRHPDNDIVFSSPMVSRMHAILYTHDGQLWIRDDRSTNGTFVNGVQIRTDTIVQPDDELSLGPACRLQVRSRLLSMSA